MKTENNKKSTFNPGDIIWWVCVVVCIGIIAVIAIFLFQDRELPLAIISAVLGVVMTIAATASLFWGQTRQQSRLAQEQAEHQANLVKRQQEGETETEKFKERLKAYNSFLDSLSDYIEIRDEKKRTLLTFRTAALAMHTNDEKMIEINKEVGNILSLYNKGDQNELEVLESLYKLSDIFYSDLYGDNRYSLDNDNRKEVKDSIIQLAENIQPDHDDEVKEETTVSQEEVINVDSNKTPSWDTFITSLTTKGWKIEKDFDATNFKNPGKEFEIKIRRPKKGTYLIEGISTNDDKELIRKIKENIGGHRNGNVWWENLKSLPSYKVKNGELIEALSNNLKARAYIINWIEKLIKEIS